MFYQLISETNVFICKLRIRYLNHSTRCWVKTEMRVVGQEGIGTSPSKASSNLQIDFRTIGRAQMMRFVPRFLEASRFSTEGCRKRKTTIHWSECPKVGYLLQLRLYTLTSLVPVWQLNWEEDMAICWAWHTELIAALVKRQTYVCGQALYDYAPLPDEVQCSKPTDTIQAG